MDSATYRGARDAWRWPRPYERGQTVVEFALVVPILLFILFAIIQFSILMLTNSAVSFAARQAARVASIHAADYNDPTYGNANDEICKALRDALHSNAVDPNKLGTVTIFRANSSSGSSEVNAAGDDNNLTPPVHDVDSCDSSGTWVYKQYLIEKSGARRRRAPRGRGSQPRVG